MDCLLEISTTSGQKPHENSCSCELLSASEQKRIYVLEALNVSVRSTAKWCIWKFNSDISQKLKNKEGRTAWDFLPCQIHNISHVWDRKCSALLLGMGAPQPIDGIVGQDYHMGGLVLCNPTSIMTPQVIALFLQVLQCPTNEQETGLDQAASYCQWRWLRWPWSNILWQTKG